MPVKKISLIFSLVVFSVLLCVIMVSCSGHEHSLVFRQPKEATCASEGNVGYWVCEKCDMYFSDIGGNKQIEDKDSVIIPMTDHTFGDRLKYDKETHYYLCSVCGGKKDEAPHTFNDIFICTGCGYTEFYEGFTFSSESGGVYITGTDLTGEITIPGTYRDMPVIGIAPGAFSGNRDITAVTIENGIYEIGASAFEGCVNLKSVVWPESVRLIGEKAFKGSGLTSLTLTGNLINVGSEAFSSCSELVSLTVSDGVESIAPQAFRDCTALKEISFSQGLKSIGDSAFRGCGAIESVSLPGSLTEIGSYAFAATGIKNLDLEGSGLAIGASAFRDCLWLDGVVIGEGVITIGDEAFSGCLGLGDLTIGGDVTEIGQNAFRNCVELLKLEIPVNVIKIGYGAFSNCNKITEAVVPFVGSRLSDTENSHFGFIFGAAAYNDNSRYVPSALKKVTVLAGGGINASSFRGCNNITEVVICDGIGVIGGNSFSGCASLSKITIPSSVTDIGYKALADCGSLTEIVYGGTAEEWEAVSKGIDWDENTGDYKIECAGSVLDKEII